MQRQSPVSFLSTIRRTLRRHGMVARGERVLVAVSGGPDSVALLGALQRLAPGAGIALHAAHFNHRWRGDESDRDQACAVAVAAQLGVPCTAGVAAGAPHTSNLEAQARAQRYAFLEEVAAAHGCARIATGHTRDDQAETVLMRLLRGSGWDGMAGIRPLRGRVIRPLIDCSRADILAFLDHAGLPHCDDSSNADRRFLRNRVRHEILPLLHAINPEVARHLSAVADILAAEGAVLDARVAPVLRAAVEVGGALNLSAVRALPPALVPRLLRAWLREQRGDLVRLGAAHIQTLQDVACGSRPNAQVRLPGGQVAVREYERLYLRAGAARPAAAPQVIVPGEALELPSGWRIVAELVSPALALPGDLWSLAADADAIDPPLIVRTAQPGDRIRPLGMRGQRKLHDVFVDRKLPAAQRRTCPVVEVNGEVLWVPGCARSALALITPSTRSVLRLVAENPPIAGAKPLC